MPIYRRLPTIDLAPIDELIAARRLQWKELGTPQSLALNKSGVLILSALLQGHIESVFLSVSWSLLPHLKVEELETFGKSIGPWGNPSAENINRLFNRVGVVSIVEKLSWQKTDAKKIAAHLRSLNELRNKIAHGKSIEGSLKLSQIERYRAFVEQFSKALLGYLYRRFRRQLVVRQ